jgi:hypothetical protein
VLAEAEDHLRESVAAGLAIGMTEREAQDAAISAFGPVRAVVRAHHRRLRQLAADLVMGCLKLGWAGRFAIAASGFVARTRHVPERRDRGARSGGRLRGASPPRPAPHPR